MDFTSLLNKARFQRKQTEIVIGNLFLFNGENVAEGIRHRWLFGKDPNGGIIGNYRNSEYQAFKVSMNSNAKGYVDLTLTGALGRGLTFRRKSRTEYEVFSTDSKFEMIADKYGIENFNLDYVQLQELLETLTLLALEDAYQQIYMV